MHHLATRSRLIIARRSVSPHWKYYAHKLGENPSNTPVSDAVRASESLWFHLQWTPPFPHRVYPPHKPTCPLLSTLPLCTLKISISRSPLSWLGLCQDFFYSLPVTSAQYDAQGGRSFAIHSINKVKIFLRSALDSSNWMSQFCKILRPTPLVIPHQISASPLPSCCHMWYPMGQVQEVGLGRCPGTPMTLALLLGALPKSTSALDNPFGAVVGGLIDTPIITIM